MTAEKTAQEAVETALLVIGENPDDAHDDAPGFLDALAADGWAVIRTEWEWFEGRRRRKAIPASPWEPVPEGSDQ